MALARALPLAMGRPAPLVHQIARFACVGLASTGVHLGLFALIHTVTGAQRGNLVALVIATIANTTLNRRWTFGITGTAHAGRQHAQALLVFGMTWAASSGALWLVPHLTTQSTAASTTALALAMGGSTMVRFALMRAWIFRKAHH